MVTDLKALTVSKGRLSGVDFKPARCSGGAISPEVIVLHDTAGRLDPGSSVRWFQSDKCQTSAHLVVEVDGTVTQMVPLDRKAFHAGASVYEGRQFCNAFSIGIEIVNPGKLDKDGNAWFGKATTSALTKKKTKEHGEGFWLPYTEAQITAVKALCRAIVAAYPDCNAITTHWCISPGRKIDPNPLLPLESIRAYAFGIEEPETADKAPVASPVVAPPKITELAKVSRKASRLLGLSRALHAIWMTFSLSAILEWLGYLKEVYNGLTGFVQDHTVAVVVTSALVILGIIKHIFTLMAEDVANGTYVPSGLAHAGPAVAGVEDVGDEQESASLGLDALAPA